MLIIVPNPVPGRPVQKNSVPDDERPSRKIFYTEIGNDVGMDDLKFIYAYIRNFEQQSYFSI